jgi:N6-L-threonylcarbamoyladenine synthase
LASLEYCSDNAAMIGRAAVEEFIRGDGASYNAITVNPRCKL